MAALNPKFQGWKPYPARQIWGLVMVSNKLLPCQPSTALTQSGSQIFLPTEQWQRAKDTGVERSLIWFTPKSPMQLIQGSCLQHQLSPSFLFKYETLFQHLFTPDILIHFLMSRIRWSDSTEHFRVLQAVYKVLYSLGNGQWGTQDPGAWKSFPTLAAIP